MTLFCDFWDCLKVWAHKKCITNKNSKKSRIIILDQPLMMGYYKFFGNFELKQKNA